MKVHSFNVDEAVKYGVEKAVIIYNLRFWLEKNKANDTNKHDGYYWTYNSAKAFSELFPYFKERKIARLLTQLEEENVILAGHFNKKGYDRTKWYSMPEFAVETQEDDVDLSEETGSNPCGTPFVKSDKCICQICQIHLSKMTNPFVKNDQPIPDINQIENTDSKPDDTNGEQKNGETDNDESKSKTKKRGKKKQEVDFEPRDYPIPSYIDKELWIAYHDMRDSKKAKATEYACKLLVKKFEQWHQEGLDVRPAIEASIISRWTDVFKNKAVQLQQTRRGETTMQTINQLTSQQATLTNLDKSWNSSTENTATQTMELKQSTNMVISLFEDWQRMFGSKLKERQYLDLRTAELWAIALKNAGLTMKEFETAAIASLNLEWPPTAVNLIKIIKTNMDTVFKPFYMAL